jgi:DNA-binding transcriptional regulator YiaG
MTTTANLDDLPEELRAEKLPPPSVRRRLREDAGLSLNDAASYMGVAKMTVLRWERGAVKPRRAHARMYRRFLDALVEGLR